MKLYFVGGVFQPEATDAAATAALLRTSMGELGAEFARAGHELVVCSPYEGSVDVEIVRGAAGAVDEPVVHIHYPDTAAIRSEVQALASDHPKLRLRSDPPSHRGEADQPARPATPCRGLSRPFRRTGPAVWGTGIWTR